MERVRLKRVGSEVAQASEAPAPGEVGDDHDAEPKAPSASDKEGTDGVLQSEPESGGFYDEPAIAEVLKTTEVGGSVALATADAGSPNGGDEIAQSTETGAGGDDTTARSPEATTEKPERQDSEGRHATKEGAKKINQNSQVRTKMIEQNLWP